MRFVDTRSGLEVLELQECHELLRRRQVGRLAVVDGAHPLVFPVNYTFADGVILFRTDTGTKLTRALRAPVAFEIDDVDEATQTGWSVLVTGRAEVISDYDAPRVTELRRLPLHPWAGEKTNWVRIVPERVSGRRINAT
jgi:nitroimidazol reductase NimA-like FMN-containing flavoprotein (pyridoxamine 5'-phosphate oxidase superfamily)